MSRERKRRAVLGSMTALFGAFCGCTQTQNKEPSRPTQTTGGSAETKSTVETTSLKETARTSVRRNKTERTLEDTTVPQTGIMNYTTKTIGRPIVSEPQYATSEELHSGVLLTNSTGVNQISPEVRDGEIGTFVRNTDFERACLLIIQTRLPSAGTFDLESVEKADDETIRAVSVVESTPGPSAETNRTVVARVVYSGSTPSSAAITIRNPSFKQGEELRFEIDAVSD